MVWVLDTYLGLIKANVLIFEDLFPKFRKMCLRMYVGILGIGISLSFGLIFGF